MIKQLIKKIMKSPAKEIECAVDDEPVDCVEFKEPYLGVPAPSYLPEDPWFPSPVFSEKQIVIKEAHQQAVLDQQILFETKESEDIHQKLYEIASKNWTTVGETQVSSQGGSENFQEGPGGWDSGTGYNQFR